MTGEICASNKFVIKLGDGIPPEVPPDDVTRRFELKTPLYAFVDKPVSITGTTPEANQHFYIMQKEESWNVDWLNIDKTLYEGNSDGEGKYEIELLGFEEIGVPSVYAVIRQADFADASLWDTFWGWLMPSFAENVFAVKTGNQRIVVVNWGVIAAIAAIIGLVGYKLYKKGGKK